MGRGRAGKVQLVLEVVLVLRLPLQADLLPEAPGLAPAARNTAQVRGRPRGRGTFLRELTCGSASLSPA